MSLTVIDPAVGEMTFPRAPELERIARRYIEQYHPHLANARIIYLFRTTPWTSKGKVVYGRAYKLSGWQAEHLKADFVIIINLEVWRRLSPRQREALVDHELCHCGVEVDADGYPRLRGGEYVWKLWGHDLEEFKAVVERHGMWLRDIEEFQLALGQTSLFDRPEAAGAPAEDDNEAGVFLEVDGQTVKLGDDPDDAVRNMNEVARRVRRRGRGTP